MKKHYNIILANAPINNGNRGCVALSITTLWIIDKIMKEAGIEYNIFLPDSQFYDGKEHSCLINGIEVKYTDCTYIPTNPIKKVVKDLLNSILGGHKSNVNRFKDADYILDIGQGDSFADIYGYGRFKMIDKVHQIAQNLNIPYCILPQTIGPFNDTTIKALANKSIANASLCMARDRQSFDYVVNNVPSQQTIKEYIDVAFFMPYEKIEQNRDYIHVGLNVSALLWNGGYNNDNQFGLKDDYKLIVRNIIEYFLSFPNVKLHLVSHVVLREHDIENDYEVAYKLWREYKNPNLELAPFALSPIDIKSYIAGLNFFMGARMHATIGAFSSGVPVVPMAYSRKFNGLFEDTLDYHFMTDLKAQTKDDIFSTVKNAFENRSDLKEIIKNRMQTIVKDREQLLNENLRGFFNIR